MSLISVSSVSVVAGNPAPVTVYDGNDNLVPTAQVNWSLASGGPLPSTLTVSATPAGGFIFNSAVTGSFNVKASSGAASVTCMLNFLGLKITNP